MRPALERDPWPSKGLTSKPPRFPLSPSPRLLHSFFSSSRPLLLDLSALTKRITVYLKGYCRQMLEGPLFLCGTEPITESSPRLFVSFWLVLCSVYFPLLPFSPLCMYLSLLLSPRLSFNSLNFPRGLRLCFCFCFSSLLSSVPDIFANTL